MPRSVRCPLHARDARSVSSACGTNPCMQQLTRIHSSPCPRDARSASSPLPAPLCLRLIFRSLFSERIGAPHTPGCTECTFCVVGPTSIATPQFPPRSEGWVLCAPDARSVSSAQRTTSQSESRTQWGSLPAPKMHGVYLSCNGATFRGPSPE